MTFTSTLLAVLAGIALWQLIIFIGFSLRLDDYDSFLFFITCFFSLPLLIILPIIGKLILFACSKLFVKANFYLNGEQMTSTLVAKRDRKLFETDMKSKQYVTFEKIKFKSLPVRGDIYRKGQKYCHSVKVDNYLKKRD